MTETKYEFNCPKCGYYWNNENSHAVKSTNNNYQLESPDYVNAHEVWLEAFNRYFKIRDAVLQSFDSYTFWEQSYVEIAYEEINKI